MAQSHIPDGLVKLTQVLNESNELRLWFVGLKTATFSDRTNAFNTMAKRMREDRRDEEVVSAVFLLAQPEIYRAVLNAVAQ